MRANLFMIFKYTTNSDVPLEIGTLISQKAFDTFIGSNQPAGTRLAEEDVTFPWYIMGGRTRRVLVHYTPEGDRFAAYLPVFPTEAEIVKYEAAFGR